MIFVHGCFWHRHENCRLASIPRSRRDFWEAKFVANVARDTRQQAVLREQGWEILVVWQCETRDPDKLKAGLMQFLGAPRITWGRMSQ